MEEINPNYTLPDVTKGLDFQDLEKAEVLYEDEDGGVNIGGIRTEEVPNDEQLAFTSPIVYGFSFSDKRWRELKLS